MILYLFSFFAFRTAPWARLLALLFGLQISQPMWRRTEGRKKATLSRKMRDSSQAQRFAYSVLTTMMVFSYWKKAPAQQRLPECTKRDALRRQGRHPWSSCHHCRGRMVSIGVECRWERQNIPQLEVLATLERKLCLGLA
jgi:hypothetical protein